MLRPRPPEDGMSLGKVGCGSARVPEQCHPHESERGALSPRYASLTMSLEYYKWSLSSWAPSSSPPDVTTLMSPWSPGPPLFPFSPRQPYVIVNRPCLIPLSDIANRLHRLPCHPQPVIGDVTRSLGLSCRGSQSSDFPAIHSLWWKMYLEVSACRVMALRAISAMTHYVTTREASFVLTH